MLNYVDVVAYVFKSLHTIAAAEIITVCAACAAA
jgi:hypothetical protein